MSVSLPRECAERLRELLSRDSRGETACIVASDWKLIPMTNVSEHPAYEFKVTAEDQCRIGDMLEDGTLFGIAHSHPGFKAFPSIYDIRQHQFNVQLLIYSPTEDRLRMFPPDEIQRMEEEIPAASYLYTLMRPEIFVEIDFKAA